MNFEISTRPNRNNQIEVFHFLSDEYLDILLSPHSRGVSKATKEFRLVSGSSASLQCAALWSEKLKQEVLQVFVCWPANSQSEMQTIDINSVGRQCQWKWGGGWRTRTRDFVFGIIVAATLLWMVWFRFVCDHSRKSLALINI